MDTDQAVQTDNNIENNIRRYDKLSYDDCLRDHIEANQPFILTASATAHWPCRTLWTAPHAPASFLHRPFDQTTQTPGSEEHVISRPNLAYLKQQYGAQVVPVANTLRREYNEFERADRPLGDVINLWDTGGVVHNDEGTDADPTPGMGVGVGEGAGLYVKDWHLMAELEAARRGVGEVYEVPECFRDDWLNPPYQPGPRPPIPGATPSSQGTSQTAPHSPSCSGTTSHTSDFRFTYLGPRGTFTPLHRDVYASYSWSANVAGRKQWWLVPPASLEALRDKPSGELVFDVREVEEGELRRKGVLIIIQQEGEVIFVPSGWYHQVLNLDFCISINHNFFSSLTLPRIYAALCTAQDAVEAAIADVRDMIRERHGVAVSPFPIDAGARSNPGATATANATATAPAELLQARNDQGPVADWEKEWAEEVQRLLVMDAGWGWEGFWRCVMDNLQASLKIQNPPAPPRLSPPPAKRDAAIRSVVELYSRRRDWQVLDDVRDMVRDIEAMLDHEAER